MGSVGHAQCQLDKPHPKPSPEGEGHYGRVQMADAGTNEGPQLDLTDVDHRLGQKWPPGYQL